jgi:hypothetical protein
MQLYEVTIGVPDLADAMRYFAAFGFEGGPMGTLTATEAKRLYGVASGVRAIRLRHQQADHGLVRLMQWDEPTSDGLGLAPLSALGSRWTAQHTADLARLEFHAHAALSVKDGRFRMAGPVGGPILDNAVVRARPFWDDLAGAREFVMFQPYFRQLFYSRYFHRLPNYGAINPEARFRTSQVTHAGLVLQGDDRVLDFYVEHLGMTRTLQPRLGTPISLPLYDLPDGATEWYLYWVQDARSSSTDYGRTLSGRIIVLRFGDSIPLSDCRALCSTGCLGMSSYTVQVPEVADLEALRERIGRSDATEVGPVAANEFGEPSFHFRAPDGYTWLVVGR